MAELFSLAEELSCAICLESFNEPVTTPCGHNFCRECLDKSWSAAGGPYQCPQCRAVYRVRPQLQKNTVLCAVVEQLLQAELAQEALPDGWTPPARTQTPSAARQVACDHCLKETAVKTCLVCMASFCQEHLKPHLDSPAFRDHLLQQPVFDLMRRKCPQHNRLREFFCPEHIECICHVCLVDHKNCSPVPLSQATTDMESKMKHKLTVLYGQINGASKALEDVRVKQQSVRPLESSFYSTDLPFPFQKATKLQGVITKSVYIPKVELNHELIKGIYQGSSELKNELKQCIKQCQDKTKEPTCSGDPGEQHPTTPHKPSYPMKKVPTVAAASPNKVPYSASSGQSENLKQAPEGAAKPIPSQPNAAAVKAKVLEAFLVKPRAELLQYSVKVILDYNTAHNKVALSGNYTEASVADTPQNYRPHPQRFVLYSQVLGLHCYKKGIHYWEVELQKNSFCGVGVCYGSMDRLGLESRLGRNSASWCVEWFNNKISAWHNNVEKTLPSSKTTRVGVLLNCDHGFVIFFGVTDKIYVLYKFRADFTEALYPAFWVFSADTMLSICYPK
ncbi:E3 ubiquitin/ISG15 ligase TRIM25 [Galemys pyrenaicus]|uniref:E3 ubiquitin/ISG15 ligase TRIM25 n=1 Tax=Galemys pyrenaicus TaxID=202257 RepID=A0A8J6AGB3_GALPY|nr:E3 ubiquitin/ISG15 ligase TRIM25 [Galemys pyrenaicus]